MNNTSNSTYTSETYNSNKNDYYFIITICFFLMILSYISIYKIYCMYNIHDKKDNNNKEKYDYTYEPLFNNYGTLEEI